MFRKNFYQIVLAFGIFCLASLNKFNVTCRIYKDIGFDAQALLAWDYSSYLNLIPYKEVFYPYGAFSYYINHNTLFQIVIFFLSPFLYTIFFILFQAISKNKFFSILAIILFYSFVEKFIGQATFNRYGIITVLSCITAFLFYRNTYLSKKIIFILGLSNGIIFSFLHDQGVYGFLIILLFIFINPILKNGIKNLFAKNYYKNVTKSLAVFLVGIFVGLIPFLVYLFYNESISDFFVYLSRFSDMSLYAKTAFFPYSRSLENLFTFASIFLTISYVTYSIFLKKFNLDLIFYLQLSLITVLIILEQKNLIRSMAQQITFISLLLFILLALRYKIKLLYFFIIVIIFIYISPLNVANRIYIKEKLSQKECLNKNINNFLTNHEEYGLVKQKIKKNFGYKGKIFSFPQDPIFYLIFSQIPPYYSNNYDSSSINAQEKQIAYMEKNNVDYIIYNTNVPASQDGVPNYVRTSEETKYILNHFSPKEKVDNFFILERNKKNDDFLKNKMLDTMPNFKRSLLQVDLANIPRAEGLYKKKYLFTDKNKTLFSFSSFEEVNQYLKKNIVESLDKFLVITNNKKIKKDEVITIKTKDKLITTIRFYACEANIPCIINLSRVPLFYKTRILNSVSSTYGKNINIKLLDIANIPHFW